jgi:hypothetical protein
MMENARNNKPIFTASLIIICVLSAILSLGLIRHLKQSESKFKNEKAVLVREKMELKDELDFLKSDLKMKGDTITSLEAEKKEISQEIARLKKLAEELKTDNEELGTLRKKSQELQKELEALRNARPAGETSFDVQLEPIVVTGDTVPGSRAFGQIQGKVFSVNPKKNLIVIDIGQTNGAIEGLQCRILDSEGQVGTATIIKTRYEISAAFVDTLSPGRTIRDVKEGNQVLAK